MVQDDGRREGERCMSEEGEGLMELLPPVAVDCGCLCDATTSHADSVLATPPQQYSQTHVDFCSLRHFFGCPRQRADGCAEARQQFGQRWP